MSVSIIVCARNEEKNIKNLIEALLCQDYDSAYIEIVIADDQSSDQTGQIIKEYCEKHSCIKYFKVSDRENSHSPKKNALKQAINLAKGDILLLTDADCIPSKNWINSHICTYSENPDTDMVVGFSKTKTNKNHVYQIFEHMDFFILMIAAQGAIQSGRPFSASGQNLSYKKSTYIQLNGFENLESFISGDDLLLMQKFVKNKKKVKFAAFSNAYTDTQPINSWKELFNQRARWASNLKVMPKMNFMFFCYLLTCFICMGIIPFVSIYLYLIKIFSDLIYILNAQKLYKFDDFNCFSLLLWFIINPFYILIVSFMGVFSIFKWRDRMG